MRKSFTWFATVVLIFAFLIAKPIYADLFINEFSSSTSDDDWIEIYNSGPESIDLGDYRLRDDTATNKLDLGDMLAPQGFKVFQWSNKLNNSGDIIKLILKNDENNITDQVAYGDKGNDVSAPSGNQSAGRQSNGSAQWIMFASPSRESSNSNSSPAPTPTSTPQPTPTKAPTPKNPTPTKIPTPAKSSASKSPTLVLAKVNTVSPPQSLARSKTQTLTSTKPASISGIPTSVLGIGSKSADKNSDSGTPKKNLKVNSTNQFNPFPFAAGLIFIAVCAILVIRIRRKSRQV